MTRRARRPRSEHVATQNLRDRSSGFVELKRSESLLKGLRQKGWLGRCTTGPAIAMKTPLSIALSLLAVTAPAIAARRSENAVQSSFLYAIDDGAGRRSTGWAALTWEPKNSELFLVANGVVDIFNDNGLATYSFGDDAQAGSPVAVAALENGDLMVIASREMATVLVRCNFRGEPQAKVALHGLPAELTGFSPNAI